MMDEPVDISPKKDAGVLKVIVKEGSGDELPPKGCKVSVHYTGTFVDGNKFDSSRDRNDPFIFDLGKGTVIKAWDIGVATMRRGERAILTCSPEYAYGQAGSPPKIPANSTLKFDIEVLSWQGEDLSVACDGGIQRLVITEGEGYSTPNDGALVYVHLIGKCENQIFDEREISFNVGEGSEVNVIPGIETAIAKFKKGEKSRLIIKPKYAFGENGSHEYNIPPNATVEYIVTLNKFERAKEISYLDSQEKIEQSRLFKDKGTAYFKAGKHALAIKMYERIQQYLETDRDTPEDERNSLLLASYLNIALCELKLKDYFKARAAATSALNIDPNNEKALYRRGQALLSIEEPELASRDFMRCLEMNPKNTSAKNLLDSCNKTLKEQKIKEKKIYANMFAKFAKMDTEREEFERTKQPNVMSSVGEWGQEDREREPSEFEKENPDILLLNKTGEFKDM